MTDPQPSDTALQPTTTPPPPLLERIVGAVGNLARPFVLYAIGWAALIASVIVAFKVTDALGGAAVLTAIFAGLSAIYWGKAVENINVAKQDAIVKTAQAQPGATP